MKHFLKQQDKNFKNKFFYYKHNVYKNKTRIYYKSKHMIGI